MLPDPTLTAVVSPKAVHVISGAKARGALKELDDEFETDSDYKMEAKKSKSDDNDSSFPMDV